LLDRGLFLGVAVARAAAAERARPESQFVSAARLKRMRARRGPPLRQEQAAIEQWLGLIAQAARASADIAIEVAECARLVKGYGDTWQRGVANYQTIEAQVIRPILAGHIPLAKAPTRSRARAPPRWSIRRARASPGAWPRSRAAPRRCASRRSDPRPCDRSTLRRDVTLDEPGDLPVVCLLALREALHDADAILCVAVLAHLPFPSSRPMTKRKPTMPRSMTRYSSRVRRTLPGLASPALLRREIADMAAQPVLSCITPGRP